MNHLSEEKLILYHYGEVNGRQDIAVHLDTCDACRARYQVLKQTLTLVNGVQVPERDENYGADVWRRLKPQLGRPGESTPGGSYWKDFWAKLGSFPSPRLALAGGVCLLVACAFVAGRFWQQRTNSSTATLTTQLTEPATPQARERVLLSEIGDHLERSQMALIELVNSKTNGPVDISLERELAEELVSVNRLYRQAAARAGNIRIANVLEDLERTLIEIANSPSKLSSADFAEFRRRLDTEDMLFKIKVVSSQVRAQEQQSARTLAGTRS